MKKTQPARLSLHRETLQNLAGGIHAPLQPSYTYAQVAYCLSGGDECIATVSRNNNHCCA